MNYHIQKTFFSLLLVMAFFNCKNQPEMDFLTVETTRLNFSAEQNTRTISCLSHATVEAMSSQPAWCTIKVVHWNNSSAIEINVSKNTIVQERTATITVSDGKVNPVQIDVKQASGAPFLNIEAGSMQQFNPQSAQRQLTVNANVPFTATSSAPLWCTAVIDPDATVGNLTVSVTDNDSMADRYAEIVVAASGFSNAKINVVQYVRQIVIDPGEEEDENFDDAGHRIFSKAASLTFLKRNGPFIRLKDGGIFSVTGGACIISRDEGKTWTEFPVADPEKFLLGSPVAVQTHNGTIIIGFSNSREMSPLNWNKTTHCYDPNAKLPTYIVYSKNNGYTWSMPVKLHDSWTGMNREILETKDGHVVFSTMIMRNNLGRHCVLTYVSSDDGATWTPGNVLDSPKSAGDHGGLMEAAVIQLNDGRLWMLIRTNWDYFYESYSSDNGFTWSGYQKTNIDASSSPAALLRLQSGRMVLVWNRLYHEGENTVKRLGGDSNISEVAASWQRDELSMMYSDDDAKTWSKPFIIAKNTTRNDNSKWLSYPHVFEQSKGLIWITTDFGSLRIVVREDDLP